MEFAATTRKLERGFSLLEVQVCIILLMVVLLGMSSALLQCTRLQANSADTLAAYRATRDLVERLRHQDPSEVLASFASTDPAAAGAEPSSASARFGLRSRVVVPDHDPLAEVYDPEFLWTDRIVPDAYLIWASTPEERSAGIENHFERLLPIRIHTSWTSHGVNRTHTSELLLTTK